MLLNSPSGDRVRAVNPARSKSKPRLKRRDEKWLARAREQFRAQINDRLFGLNINFSIRLQPALGSESRACQSRVEVYYSAGGQNPAYSLP